MYRRKLLALVTLLVLVGSTTVVLAAGGDGTINYQGRLERDGEAVDGTYTLTFRFFGAATGGSQIGSDLSYADVDVRGGRFSVALGPVPVAALQADPLFLEVAVGTTTADQVTLGARQRIFAVPYAMRGRGGSTFTMEGVAEAVNGLFSTGVVEVEGVLSIGVNAGGSGARTISFARDASDNGNAGKIAYKGFGGTHLAIVGAGVSDSDRKVKIYDQLEVVGSISTTALTASSTQAQGWCDCEKSTELESGASVATYNGGGESGSAYYQCRGQRFLVGMFFSNNTGIGTHAIEQYKCCRPCDLVAN